VKATLPPEYLQYLAKIEDSLKVGLKPYKDYGRHQDIISSVNAAVVDKTYIRISYYTMNRKKLTRRTVAPYKVWFFDGTFYLLAHCLLRKKIRLFAVDRIKSIETTNESFELPPDFDINGIMRSSFGAFLGEPVEVVIWFSADVAGYIEEKVWHESQALLKQDDGSVILKLKVAGTDEIKFWIMTWGAKARVIQPHALRDQIVDEAAAMLDAYAQAPCGCPS
jgi:predicted DNA-binding transcriptional regulator YafY